MLKESSFCRDLDLQTLKSVSQSLLGDSKSKFVVTGSYAIEALTQKRIFHNDIDANILTPNGRFDWDKILKQGYKPTSMSDSLLEFEVFSQYANRKVEINVIRGDVPLVRKSILDSKGNEIFFYVKSLDYSIATWAIRISGFGSNKKREVRGSDIDNLKLLLGMEYSIDKVKTAMLSHPQYPPNIDPSIIFDAALKRADIIA